MVLKQASGAQPLSAAKRLLYNLFGDVAAACKTSRPGWSSKGWVITSRRVSNGP